MTREGNVAFKVTWVYGDKGPWTSACNWEGRQINIGQKKVTWCSQPDCLCNKLYLAGNTAPPCALESATSGPCYDANIFHSWSFESGVYHNGLREGESIPMRRAKVGKLAFFTSRRYDRHEKDRKVIGCFEIDSITSTGDGGKRIKAAHGGLKIRMMNLDAAPNFWDFYELPSGPSWGTGLFRYLDDKEAKELLEQLKLKGVVQ